MRIIEIDRLQLDQKTRLRGREILIKSTQSNNQKIGSEKKGERNTGVQKRNKQL